MILRVVLPQTWPRLIDALRLSLGAAWLFLIAAEAIASTEGLGYRIFLVRRYLAMDVILPYVAWITLLAFTMDWLLRLLRAKAFPLGMSGGAAMTQMTVKRLWKEYGDQVVLENVNLHIGDHEFVTIIGASGCGKTTFLRMLLGVETPSRGEFLIDGRPLPASPGPIAASCFSATRCSRTDGAAESAARARAAGGAGPGATVRRAAPRPPSTRRSELLEAVGLGASRGKYPAQLSGGMQQRLSIAQSVICEPKILLLDEPFGALDPGVTADMHALILKLWNINKMTIVMVTHDVRESFHLGTRLLVFDKVRIDPQAPDRVRRDDHLQHSSQGTSTTGIALPHRRLTASAHPHRVRGRIAARHSARRFAICFSSPLFAFCALGRIPARLITGPRDARTNIVIRGARRSRIRKMFSSYCTHLSRAFAPQPFNGIAICIASMRTTLIGRAAARCRRNRANIVNSL